MRITAFIFLFIFNFFTNQKELKTVFTETNFSTTCIALKNDLKKGHGGLISKNDGTYLEGEKFGTILNVISKYDINQKDNYEIEKVTSGKIHKMIWKSAKAKNCKRFVKITFKTKEKEGITIVDYYMYRKVKPFYIHLRILEDEFEKLEIDQTLYNSYFESRLVGADDAIQEFDKLLQKN